MMVSENKDTPLSKWQVLGDGSVEKTATISAIKLNLHYKQRSSMMSTSEKQPFSISQILDISIQTFSRQELV